MIVLVMAIKARGFSRKWRSETMEKLASGPVLESPDNYRARKSVVVWIQDRGFKRFTDHMIKPSVIKTK